MSQANDPCLAGNAVVSEGLRDNFVNEVFADVSRHVHLQAQLQLGLLGETPEFQELTNKRLRRVCLDALV